MKLKKLIAGITSAVMLCSINVFSGANDSFIADAYNQSDEMKYGDYLSYIQVDNDENGTYDYIEISDYDESVTEILIPAEIDGVAVKEIGYEAFYRCTSLASIEIPDSVTSIVDKAFYNCKSLESITIKNPNYKISDFKSTISNGQDDNENYYYNGIIYGYENSTVLETLNITCSSGGVAA